ncbi:heparinase II/III domain-containing protein [Oceanobacillus kapialis]|uniref:Heparinase II/III family protein n=1 Tax=Oceanobacillus kapialis TaxID=481353 RepID=A0ABW5PX62_9BACI
MYVGGWLDDSENWYYPKSSKITVEDKANFIIKSDFETGYLIYGDNNGFENPPRKKNIKISTGKHTISFKGVKDNSLTVQLYLLLYNSNNLENKIRFDLNQEINFQINTAQSFKIALRIEGKGKLEINNMFIKEIKEEPTLLKLDKENYKHFEVILPNNHNKDYQLAVNQLNSSNLFNFRNYGTVQYNQSIDWLDDHSKGRGYLRLLNGFVWLGDFTKAAKVSKSKSIVNRALSLIHDWIEKNPYPGPKKNMAWHDETSALRLLNWINFLFAAEEVTSHKDLRKLYLEIRKLVDIMLSEEFYAGKNNHGMFQSFALIVYANLFINENTNRVKNLAINRLKVYFEYIISEEGVHKEHTPLYHYIIASNLKKYGEILINIDKEFGEYLLQKYKSTLTYSKHIIKPNGYFPQIGDNENTKPIELGYKSLYKEKQFEFAITKGVHGVAPSINNIVFEKSGYAIFRNNWELKDEATYLLFNAAYHTSYHKHSDDLSFILYACGEDIFVDSGPFGYEYNNDFTKYGYSSFAHNTLIVDNNSLPRVDNNYDATKITSYELNKEQSEVTGVNKRYAGVVHERTIAYDNQEEIRIIDKVSSKNEHDYKLLFHLSSIIIPVIYGDKIYLYRDQVLIGIMEFTSDVKLDKQLIRGKKDNNFVQGWQFKKFGTKQQVYNISVLAKNVENLNIETKIKLFTKKSMINNYQFLPYNEFDNNEKQLNLCLKYADLLVDKSLYIPSRGIKPIYLDSKIYNWKEYPINDNSYKFRIHTLEGLEHLAKAFKKTGKVKYLNKGAEIFQSWVKNNSFVNYTLNKWSYYGQGTALRVLYLLEFLNEYESEFKLDSNFEKILYNFFVEHKSLLEAEAFYKFNDNHGMFQDVALISILLKYPSLDDQPGSSMQLAIKRLYKQINNTISADGVSKEHSPDYQLQIYNFLSKIISWLKSNKITIKEEIEQRIKKMPDFFAYLLKPDLTLPLFGDTTKAKLNLSSILNYDKYPMLAYVFSGGEEGLTPSKNKIFRESGYYVLRSTLNQFEQIYMAGIVNFNSKVHQHADNLSFELYAYGKDIIVDSGKFSYSRSKERSYMVSNLAHNTLLVNDKDMLLEQKYIGESDITSFSETNDGATVKMINNCFHSVSHVREIDFNDNGEIVLIDTIKSSLTNKYSLLFHISPEFNIKQITDHAAILESDDNSVEVEISQKSALCKLLVEDSFYSRTNYSVENNKLIRFDAISNDFEFKTSIIITKK